MKFSTTSRNSPHAFVSAPSADIWSAFLTPHRLFTPRLLCACRPRVANRIAAGPRKSLASAVSRVTPRGVQRPVHNLRSTPRTVVVHSPAAHPSPTAPQETTRYPQAAHIARGALACDEPASSPICTTAITDTHLSLSLSSRRRVLGNVVLRRSDRAWPHRMSAPSFSFQVGAESSTVVQRQPFCRLLFFSWKCIEGTL